MKWKVYLAVAYIFSCFMELTKGDVVIYPHTYGLYPSDKFTVYVRQGNGPKHRGNSLRSRSDRRFNETSEGAPNRSLSWLSFAFSGSPVTVEVHTQTDFQNCTVRPKSYGYKCIRTGSKTAQFNVTHNTRMMSVEFDYDYGSIHADIKDKLLIFADEPETDIPKNDSSVLYYGPGFHNLNGQKRLDSNIKTVYLAPGSLLKGGFISTGGSVKIYGRGILTGEGFKTHDPRFSWGVINMDAGSHHTIEGIAILDPAVFFIRALSDNLVVRNVKLIGAWALHTDGIETGANALIEDSFIMANDDAIKIYNDGMVVQRSVLWQTQNGAVFQFGWWSSHKLTKIRVTDIDIIHTDWCAFDDKNCQLKENDAVLNLAGDLHQLSISDVEFRNVRIEESCPRIIDFMMPNDTTGSVSNVRFINWSIESQPTNDSYHNKIAGAASGGRLTGWHFYNFKIGGKCISSSQLADFVIDSHTTNDIQFECSTSPGIVG